MTHISQSAIYDERYAAGTYDGRSAIRVLRAEREALEHTVGRALASHPGRSTLSLFDFGYGNGRVTNDFILEFDRLHDGPVHNVHVIAYDVSSNGLRQGMDQLCDLGFSPISPGRWTNSPDHSYLAARIQRTTGSIETRVSFIHASETAEVSTMSTLVLAVNEGSPVAITTSWYSAIAHVAGHARRQQIFDQLERITGPRGEIVIAASATGDLPGAQVDWAERLQKGETLGFPIEAAGDVMYETELGQLNYCHVFGTDLISHLMSSSRHGQDCWVEAIRLPDDEFESAEAEQANYRGVRNLNNRLRGLSWSDPDYEACHTVAAFRSGALLMSRAAQEQRPTHEPSRAFTSPPPTAPIGPRI